MYGTTGGRHHGAGDDDDHSDSSSSSSADFMANPFQAFRPSLFSALKSPPDGSEDDGNNNNNSNSPNDDTLPSLHDKSWIGARMSPIQSYNDNDTMEDNQQGKAVAAAAAVATEQAAHLHHYYSTSVARQPSGFVSLLSSQHAPSAGHARTEYPPFGIHPLQPSQWPLTPVGNGMSPNNNNNNKTTLADWCKGGTLLCIMSGLFLLCMGVYDCLYFSSSSTTTTTTTTTARWDPHWTLPLGQPSDETSIVWGALVPASVIFSGGNNNNNDNNNATSLFWFVRYWRLVTSALQSNSVLEWCFLVLAWYICQKPSIHVVSGSTIGGVYAISTLTGQLWMLALWLLYNNNNNNNYYEPLVAHCAAWGTSGVLCFIGMMRPGRRFGCFMIGIVLVVLSLWQTLGNSNPLPVVVGCTTSSFVGWALYGSHLFQPPQRIRLSQQLDQLPIPILTPASGGSAHHQSRTHIHSTVRLCCGILVMSLWMLPLLVLAYLDYWKGY